MKIGEAGMELGTYFMEEMEASLEASVEVVESSIQVVEA